MWIDASGDGVTDQGELKTLAELGIVSIGLEEHFKNGTHKTGRSVLAGTATFTRSNGMTGTVGDVALAFRPGPVPVPIAAADPDPLPIDPVDLSLLFPGLKTLASPESAFDGQFPAGVFGSAATQFASAIASFANGMGVDNLKIANSADGLALTDQAFAANGAFPGF